MTQTKPLNFNDFNDQGEESDEHHEVIPSEKSIKQIIAQKKSRLAHLNKVVKN